MSDRRPKGFSLLEVAIAMSILIVAMTALMGHEGIAIQMSEYSNRLSQATFLLQGKMLDVEYKLIKDGMDQLDDCEEGNFRDEGFRQFEWKVCAYKLEMTEGAGEQIAEQIKGLLAGYTPLSTGDSKQEMPAAGADPDQPSAADMMAGSIDMIAGFLPMFLQTLEDQVRKVRVEVTWKDAIAERTVVLERFVTVLGEDRSDESQKDSMDDLIKEAAGEVLMDRMDK